MSVKIATLNDILLTRSKVVWSYRINFDSITVSDFEKMIAWCEMNCKDIWRYEKYYAQYFQFISDTDAMMFMLKFGGTKSV